MFRKTSFGAGAVGSVSACPPSQEGPLAEAALPSQAGPLHAEHAMGPPRKRPDRPSGPQWPCSLPDRLGTSPLVKNQEEAVLEHVAEASVDERKDIV